MRNSAARTAGAFGRLRRVFYDAARTQNTPSSPATQASLSDSSARDEGGADA